MNDVLSKKERVVYGVPQGSILGPLLFVIFINDLPDTMNTCRTHLYADDTALSVSGISTNDLETQLNREMTKASEWMKRNHLTLNAKKTKVMTFGTAQTLNKVGELNISSDGTDIEVVNTFKYLGIYLDRRLTFTEHVQYIRRKCTGRIRMLAKLRPIMGQNVTLDLYKSLITPLLDYGDIIYNTLSARDNNVLQRIQNATLKIILQVPKRTSTVDIHRMLGLNMVADRRHEHTLTQVFKCTHGLAPEKVSRQIVHRTTENTRHDMQTRSMTRDDLLVPDYRLETTRGSFRFRGPSWYNRLDQDIRTAPSVNAFKNALRRTEMFKV